MAKTRHVTLTAGEVETVELGVNAARVEVLNRDGAAAVYFTTNDDDPAIAGDNTYVLPAAISALDVPDEIKGPSVVKLISSGTPAVSVRAL